MAILDGGPAQRAWVMPIIRRDAISARPQDSPWQPQDKPRRAQGTGYCSAQYGWICHGTGQASKKSDDLEAMILAILNS